MNSNTSSSNNNKNQNIMRSSMDSIINNQHNNNTNNTNNNNNNNIKLVLPSSFEAANHLKRRSSNDELDSSFYMRIEHATQQPTLAHHSASAADRNYFAAASSHQLHTAGSTASTGHPAMALDDVTSEPCSYSNGAFLASDLWLVQRDVQPAERAVMEKEGLLQRARHNNNAAGAGIERPRHASVSSSTLNANRRPQPLPTMVSTPSSTVHVQDYGVGQQLKQEQLQEEDQEQEQEQQQQLMWKSLKSASSSASPCPSPPSRSPRRRPTMTTMSMTMTDIDMDVDVGMDIDVDEIDVDVDGHVNSDVCDEMSNDDKDDDDDGYHRHHHDHYHHNHDHHQQHNQDIHAGGIELQKQQLVQSQQPDLQPSHTRPHPSPQHAHHNARRQQCRVADDEESPSSLLVSQFFSGAVVGTGMMTTSVDHAYAHTRSDGHLSRRTRRLNTHGVGANACHMAINHLDIAAPLKPTEQGGQFVPQRFVRAGGQHSDGNGRRRASRVRKLGWWFRRVSHRLRMEHET